VLLEELAGFVVASNCHQLQDNRKGILSITPSTYGMSVAARLLKKMQDGCVLGNNTYCSPAAAPLSRCPGWWTCNE
jgi:hypothetical protein